MDAITQMKALTNGLKKCIELAEELEDTKFSDLSFRACEKDLNDALGLHGNKSWNDMIKEVETLRMAKGA